MYGDGSSYDSISINIIQKVRNKPRVGILVYRAIPLILSNEQKINELENQKRYILKYGRIPPNAETKQTNPSRHFEELIAQIEAIRKLPPQTPTKRIGINPGDWVSINRNYAVEHGRSNLLNKYKIISKTVPASTLFTDGNSIHEWGYSP